MSTTPQQRPADRPLDSPLNSSLNRADEHLLTEIVGAVQSLEYGAVTVSVKAGKVVRLERHEKLRLPHPARSA